MDVNVTWLTKNDNEKFGKLVQVLCGEKTIECNMKYSYVDISYLNKCYVYCLFFIFCVWLTQQN